MRRFLSALVTALIVPLAAYAQAPKPVEVINDPLAVEVTTPIAIVEPVAVEITEPLAVEVVNPAPPSPAARFQLVGFTSATYTGAMGEHFGITQKCQLEFENSRMCTVIEVKQTTSIPSGLVGQGWVNKGFSLTGSDLGASCGAWLVEDSFVRGTSVTAHGNESSVGVQSDIPTPIACCALVP